MSATDSQLLTSIALRDGSALLELFDRYGDVIYGEAIQLSLSESDAQNVLQDTYLKIWEKAATYDEARCRPLTWMLQIARKEVLVVPV